MSSDIYEKLIYENEEKGYQYRLTVSEFRDVQYLHLRKYFLDYEGQYQPTKEGAAIPATIQNTYALLDGLLEIISNEEDIDAINKYFKERLSKYDK